MKIKINTDKVKKQLQNIDNKLAKKIIIDHYNKKLEIFESELNEINGKVTVNVDNDLKVTFTTENLTEDLKKKIIDYLL